MKKVKICVVGLGRLGSSHFENLLEKIPCAEVVAACSIVPEELEKAKERGVNNLYGSYEKMLAESDAEAVILSTSTDIHARQIIAALEYGKHVFCEKPLAIKHADCVEVLKKSAEFPEKIVQIGFVRRFDTAYIDAHKRIHENKIGKIFKIHSQTSDWTEFAPFQVKFSQTSGGIFHDYNIHDIDMIHWLSDSRFKTVYCVGGSYKYPEFGEMGSADNTLCLGTLENETMVTISASRTEAHGHGTHTIVYGTEATLVIGLEPFVTRLQIYDRHGVRQECLQTFYDRFYEAFVEELRVFIDCVANGKPSPISLEEAKEATRVAEAMTESFEKQKLISL